MDNNKSSTSNGGNYVNRIATFGQRLSETAEKLRLKEKALEKLNTENGELNAEVESLRNVMRDKTRHSNELLASNKKLTKESHLLVSKISAQNQEIKEWSSKVKMSESRYQQLQSQNQIERKKLQETIAKAESTIKVQQKHILEFTPVLEKIEKEKEEFKRESQLLIAKNIVLNQEIKECSSKIEMSESRYHQMQSLYRKKVKTLQETNTERESRVEAQRRKISEFRAALGKSEMEKQKYKVELEQVKAEINNLEKTLIGEFEDEIVSSTKDLKSEAAHPDPETMKMESGRKTPPIKHVKPKEGKIKSDHNDQVIHSGNKNHVMKPTVQENDNKNEESNHTNQKHDTKERENDVYKYNSIDDSATTPFPVASSSNHIMRSPTHAKDTTRMPNGNGFFCKCGKQLISTKQLARHIEYFKFRCKKCSPYRQFPDRPSLKSHMKNKHNQNFGVAAKTKVGSNFSAKRIPNTKHLDILGLSNASSSSTSSAGRVGGGSQSNANKVEDEKLKYQPIEDTLKQASESLLKHQNQMRKQYFSNINRPN
ncbi:unnamed protein product [Orchesella dallaii]|uniref:C2H2-type domain-containing protein n=1 Tax=Orchesella dallaii TaxID=48710 RepID=A0ABP1RIY1_9HEXA